MYLQINYLEVARLCMKGAHLGGNTTNLMWGYIDILYCPKFKYQVRMCRGKKFPK